MGITSIGVFLLKMFYRSHTDANYLLQIVLPYFESLHLSKMWVYKFVELNPFGSITDLLPNDPWYVKLIAPCSTKCDEIFCNKVKSKSQNKKRWIVLFIYYGIIMYGWFTNVNCDGCMFYLYQLFFYLMYYSPM